MGCSESQVSSLLSGERRLHEDWILKFCQALDISIAELLETSTDSYAGRCSKNSSHRDLHRRLQKLLDCGLEDLVQVQISLLEAYLRSRNGRN